MEGENAMRLRLCVLLLVALLGTTALLAGSARAADMSVSTTFLTALDSGGGYIEYHVTGAAARELRTLIDDPHHLLPFETVPGNGDGTIDLVEGRAYLSNLDDILTLREIVLRGVKLDNVDVDDSTGLIGSHVNETRELYIHITFRGHIMYETKQFNVSGLEPLSVLWGTYGDIPRNLTVDERTLIVAVGISSYERVERSGGFLLNLRVPMAAVVRYTATYPVTNPPEARMSYSHSSVIGNPLALAILMLVFTFLAIRIPKATAKDDGMERVRWLHWTFLAIVILVWLFYFFGGASAIVWVLSISCLAGIYYVSHLVYDKGLRKLARPLGGIDVDDGLVPAGLEDGQAGPKFQTAGPLEPRVPMVQAGPATVPTQGQTGPMPLQGAPVYTPRSAYPTSEVVVELPAGQRPVAQTPRPAASTPPPAQPYVIPHQAAQQQQPPPQYAPQPTAQPQPYRQTPPSAQSAQPTYAQPLPLAQPPYPQSAAPAPQAPPQRPVMPPVASPTTPPYTLNGKNGKPLPPPPPPMKMRCSTCQTVFQVPGAPRPLPIKCPKCGRQGMIR